MTATKEDVMEALSKTMHPEINFSLIKLGMVKDIEIKNSEVSVTLVLPFYEIPIKDYLIELIKKSIETLDKNLKIEIKTAIMTDEEREKFMNLSREGWKF